MALSESLATNNPTYRVWLSKLFLIVLPTRRFGAIWGGEVLAEGGLYCRAQVEAGHRVDTDGGWWRI